MKIEGNYANVMQLQQQSPMDLQTIISNENLCFDYTKKMKNKRALFSKEFQV